ncbi:Alpha/Beta hydrolase protein [Pterulicium gracile]|uniref:Carboxylic ester hydrolase n=1 Tax=Pterulicium gracile TaxID=1884261 RepID=A0A5C3QZM3_9AGAR|nr:Alpha/Beta hydrolase protein [Pterula gracilis]
MFSCYSLQKPGAFVFMTASTFRLLAFLTFSTLAVAGVSPDTVDLGYATYRGNTNELDIISFLGIRYAAAPEGDLRWRAPQSPPRVSGVQAATEQPNQCFQSPFGASPVSPLRTFQLTGKRPPRQSLPADQSEDCLFLSVYLPASSLDLSASLPVVVWFHGGGYIAGQGKTFDGGDLVKASGDGVIAVVIQYRLGVFGFLGGRDVKANGDLNAGLLDQHFALEWVQQHIPKFGGDPRRVTLWGQSAGAGSILQQAIANDGETGTALFRNIITSSTFLPPQYKFDDDIPEGLFYEVVSQSNCCCAQDKIACLRDADPAALQAANQAINRAGLFGTFTFVPVVDGTFIRRSPVDSLASGKVNGARLLAVTNANEGQIFVNATLTPVSMQEYMLLLFPKFTPQQALVVSDLYARTGIPLEQQLALAHGESTFVCPTYYLLDAFEDPAKFKGEFAIAPATHGSDVPLYFPTGRNITVDDPDFTASFASSFLSFVISEDPNLKVNARSVTPSWPNFGGVQSEMLFNRTQDGLPDIKLVESDGERLERCRLWQSLIAFTGQ